MVLDALSFVNTDYTPNTTNQQFSRTINTIRNFTVANYTQITQIRTKGSQMSLIQNSSPRILGCTYSSQNNQLTKGLSKMTYKNDSKYKDNYMDEQLQIINEVTAYENQTFRENITIIATVNGLNKTIGTLTFKLNSTLLFDVLSYYSNDQKIYNLYVLVNTPGDETKLLMYTIKNNYVSISTNNEIMGRCGDDLQVSPSIIVIQCTSLKKLKIYRTINIAHIQDISLLNGVVFYQQPITGLLRAKALLLISRDSHNYVFYATRLNQTNGPFYMNVVEVIVPKNEKIEPMVTPINFLTTYDRFYMTSLMGQYIMRVPQQFTQSIEDLKIYPMCYLDQYQNGSQCQQCPPNQYSLYYSSTQCYGYDQLNNVTLNSDSYKRLNFLIQNNFPQISLLPNPELPSNTTTPPDPINNQNNNGNSQTKPDTTSSTITSKTNSSKGTDEDFNFFDGYKRGKQLSVALLVIIIGCSCCSVLTGAYCLIRKKLRVRRRLNIEDVSSSTRQRSDRERERALRDAQREVKLKKVKQLCKKSMYNEIKKQKNILDTCGICCDEFHQQDKIRLTQCCHIFHSKCLLQWVKHKINSNQSHADPPDCPYCKWNLLEHRPIEQTEDEMESPSTKHGNHTTSKMVLKAGSTFNLTQQLNQQDQPMQSQVPSFDVQEPQLVLSPEPVPQQQCSQDRGSEEELRENRPSVNVRAAWTEEAKDQE